MKQTTKVLVHTNSPNYPKISYHSVTKGNEQAEILTALNSITGSITAYINGDCIKIK